MLKFSACIEMIFSKLPLHGRFDLAAKAGMSAVEIWRYTSYDPSEIKDAIDKSGIPLSSMCVGTRDESLAEEFSKYALLSSKSPDLFCKIAEESVMAAKELGVSNLIVTTGKERDDISRYEQHTNLVLALRKAAPIFEQAGINAVLEPLNIVKDHKGYFLYSTYEAFSIIREVASSHVKLLFDIYHQQLTDGNLIKNISENIDLIGHFHVADAPGRNEPGTGEINYKNVFSTIKKSGYNAYVGLEYSPLKDDSKSLEEVVALAKNLQA